MVGAVLVAAVVVVRHADNIARLRAGNEARAGRRTTMTGSPVPQATSVAVVGAGSWGTALAIHTASAGHDVVLWGHDPSKVARMREERENAVYLAGIPFPETMRVTAVAEEALGGARLVISAVPSRFLRDVWVSLGACVEAGAHLISATKGIEEDSGLRMTQLLQGGGPASPCGLFPRCRDPRSRASWPKASLRQ